MTLRALIKSDLEMCVRQNFDTRQIQCIRRSEPSFSLEFSSESSFKIKFRVDCSELSSESSFRIKFRVECLELS